MRIKLALLLVFLPAGMVKLDAQSGGFQRRTVEERVKTIHEKFDSVYKFDGTKQVHIDSTFAAYFREQDKMREEFRNAGERPDFETMRAKMQPALDARDKELKAIMTEGEFKRWKEELEPALMQRRGGANRQQ